MINELNKEAFELIKLVVTKPKEVPSERAELVGSSKERGFTDLSDKVVGAATEITTDHIGNTIAMFLVDENGSVGFDETQFVKFKDLVKKAHSTEQLNPKVSLNFIERKFFDWVVDVYKKQRAESNLFDYLITQADTAVKIYTFFFPVLNLEIEQAFKVGNVEFTFFTKEYLDNLYTSLKGKDETMTEETFAQIFRKDFQGQVLAKVDVNAERDKAEELAKQEAEIAVSVLKLYSESAVIPEKKTMFDLNYKLGYQVQSNFLTQKPNDSESLSINLKFNNYPSNYSQKLYNSAYESGLKVFSDYLLLRKNDELHDIIIQLIHLFGSAISNWDLHLRCVNLITLLESLFLKEDEDYKMEQKTKARLSKALSNQHQEKERIKTVITTIYEVRHKMIHKGKRIDFDTKILSEAQIIMANLFLHLIDLNTRLNLTEKNKLIEILDQEKS